MQLSRSISISFRRPKGQECNNNLLPALEFALRSSLFWAHRVRQECSTWRTVAASTSFIPCHKPPRYVPYKCTYVPYNGTFGASDQGQMLDVWGWHPLGIKRKPTSIKTPQKWMLYWSIFMIVTCYAHLISMARISKNQWHQCLT